ncbi:MAG TPA: hypothetical protein VMC41_02565 [Candidatus Nanoarchaeia archaeon]|nr:hypothetical protein [Candidatus Nanoarchaeia archaeon]
MEILRAKEDFGPVKKGEQVFVLPEHKTLLAAYICLPFFIKPKLIVIELVGIILNQDAERSEKTNRSFDSTLRTFSDWKAVVENDYIYLVDVRLLEREKNKSYLID